MNTTQPAPSSGQSFKMALIIGVVLLVMIVPCILGALAVGGFVLLNYHTPVPQQPVAPRLPPQLVPTAPGPAPIPPRPPA